MQRGYYYIVLPGVLALGFFFGFYYPHPVSTPKEVRQNSSEYKYINPLIAVILGSKDQYPQYNPLENSIKAYIDTATNENKITKAAVYFRDLNASMWTGVNENDLYAPASMLKVVVMLAYLEHEEEDPSIMSKKLLYTHAPPDGGYFETASKLKPGMQTVKSLIESMIIDSDNDALTALFNNDKDHIAEVNKILRLPQPSADDGTLDFMSPRAYSLVFRTLYNATYVSREVSEKALELLTRTTFTKGLVAGVNNRVPVAHKFGERSDVSASGQVSGRELHDCGIVYKSDKPYFICVMTKGDNFDEQAEVIAGISKIVFDSVSDAIK